MPETEGPAWPADLLIELAARRGIALDRARAEALRAPVESLFGRLLTLARSLPESAAPLPGPPPLREPER